MLLSILMSGNLDWSLALTTNSTRPVNPGPLLSTVIAKGVAPPAGSASGPGPVTTKRGPCDRAPGPLKDVAPEQPREAS
jgi:hypothetical protein